MPAIHAVLLSLALGLGAPPANLDQVTQRFGAAATGLAAALERDGFAILPAGQRGDLMSAYPRRGNEVPVLVTSDAMLCLWWSVQRASLAQAERKVLAPLTTGLVQALWAAHAKQAAQAPPEELASLAGAVRLARLDVPLPPELVRAGDAVVAAADAALVTEPLPAAYDTPDLHDYARLTRWLGRYRLPLAGRGATAATVRRAAWWAGLLRDEAARRGYLALRQARGRLFGQTVEIGLDELDAALRQDGLDPAHLSDADCARVSARYPTDRPTSTRALAILPEHVSSDTVRLQAVTSELDRPSGEHVAQMLGLTDGAATFAPRDACLPERWLATLAALGEQYPAAPRFMRSPAWRAKTLNCALTSWAQMRHNSQLYSRELDFPPSAPGRREIPHGFVEPLPAFWNRFAQMVGGYVAELKRLDALTEESRVWLADLVRKADHAADDARRELAGLAPEHADEWERFGALFNVPLERPMVTARLGKDQGGVFHVASGWLYPIVEQFDLPEYPPAAAVGYVGSYYEFVEPVGQPLSDDGWAARLAAGAAPTPRYLALLGAPVAAGGK
ncbi:MAG: DUF3160 domain-containing protein [Armatimonadetes bacterium]|nr:DUF3160 domain-containing protein [Armatimonadota bacterium]